MKNRFITFNGRVYRQGNSFSTYIPIEVRKVIKLNNHEILEVKIKKRNSWYIGTFSHGRLIIPCHITKANKLNVGEKYTFSIRKVNVSMNIKPFNNSSTLDLSQFLHEKTIQGRIMKSIVKNQKLIVISTKAVRRKVAYISLNRFISKEDLGTILGYILSEGAKCNGGRVVFVNKEATLCKEFLDSLTKILSEKIDFKITCIYNPHRTDNGNLKQLLNHFKRLTKISSLKRIDRKRAGNPIFQIVINNVALNDFLLTTLNQVVTNRSSKDLEDVIISRALKGDGSLSISLKENRTRLNIAETNPIFQQFYARYCELNGLHVCEINSRRGLTVSCPFEGLLHLYKIEAFKGTVQHPRLLAAIGLSLAQKRTRYIKVLMQLDEKAIKGFNLEDIMRIYGTRNRSKCVIRLLCMLHHNFIKRIKISNSAPVARSVYKATEKIENLLILLSRWKKEYERLKKELGTKDVIETMEKVKIIFPGKNFQRKLSNKVKL
ncbi:MAG: hypothetical protein QMD14_00550 [Candidatus Aenigmarchaeota archaeon]|nr:hypothetical protein [Candidatus Aenigmarchaeota archaeon]